MRLTVVSLACIVAGASAFQYPDFVPLHKRQQPGTPAYECHANCGGIITLSRQDGFCDTSDFESKLSACLDCAVEFDIWRYYGNSVSAAAEKCGVDGTPVEPTSSTTTTATETATETTTETTTETETSSSTETETETETGEPTETESSTTVSSTSTPVIPIVTTTTIPPPGSTTSPTPTPGQEDPEDPEFTGAAALNSPAGLVMGGLLGSLIAALM
ncbi:hypothetical protein BJY01DRAFT_255569 [Aspergillus pseudoustus]|uniref:Uncharacterized protein n=1 Tax=Aspergillus pseudoustus TaxID=1810923 RepID=A0ABR4IJC6_9EURO